MIEQLKILFESPAFWGVFIPACVAAVGFVVNERSRLKWEQFQRKEERYQNMLRFLRGFYTSDSSKEDKGRFLSELHQCWLYAPDHIITLAYAFLESVHAEVKMPDEEKEARMGNLVAAIRKDLISRSIVSRTKLTGRDFKHLRAK